VSRVSAGMTLLNALPKVSNNTDGKTTAQSNINNAEFRAHSLFELQQIDNDDAYSVGTNFIKSRR